ncbi:MAG: hypothetical protein IKA03_06020 [Alphaproteobacteria bacterium]|nr:hypothetical protein [Alphaproteobacteria bacterium]
MSAAGKFIKERNLLEVLNRIARNRTEYSLLYVSVSKLKPKNRHPSFVKIIARLFDNLVGAAAGNLFVLSNSDFAILGKNITSKTVEDMVHVLRSCLTEDVVLFSQNIDDFARVYEFPYELNEFYKFIEQVMLQEKIAEPIVTKQPIDVSQIDGVIEHLNNINIAELVKHQSVIKIEADNKFRLMFQEFFVAVKDLSSQYNKNLDLVANKWLFLYLTQMLDKKTISSFLFADIKNWPQRIGLNLNLSSVFSAEFVNFAKNVLKEDQRIVVEVQMTDVLNNLNLYFEARDILHKGEHKILIDGASIEMLRMIDIIRLQPDMIKIFWDPMMEHDINNQNFKNVIDEFGVDNVILAKCKDAKAIKWGIRYGIRNFQGPYIDALEVELFKAKCPNGANCSAEDCLKRRRLIAGTFRNECPQKEFLEKMME